MITIDVTVPGVPTSKGRPRLSTRGGIARAYTPAKTRSAESDLAAHVRAQLLTGVHGGSWPSSSAMHVTLFFVLPVPASWPIWKKCAALARTIRPTSRPDLDNFVKLAKDALNGVLWVDDSQIVQLTAEKQYGVEPCTRIVAVELPNLIERVSL